MGSINKSIYAPFYLEFLFINFFSSISIFQATMCYHEGMQIRLKDVALPNTDMDTGLAIIPTSLNTKVAVKATEDTKEGATASESDLGPWLSKQQEDALWSISFGDAEENATGMLAVLIYLTMRYFGTTVDELYHFNPNKDMTFTHLPDQEVVIEYRKSNATDEDDDEDDDDQDRSWSELKFAPRLVVHFEKVTNPRGFYYWFTRYSAKLPNRTYGFWQHPLSTNYRKTDGMWYHKRKRLGRNFFNVLMKDMFKISGKIPDSLTLKSVSSTVVNVLLRNNVRIADIKQRTGRPTKWNFNNSMRFAGVLTCHQYLMTFPFKLQKRQYFKSLSPGRP